MDFKNYFKRAQKEGWAIGQFNISNLETLKAILGAAQKLKSPVIIGTSEKESKFLGLKEVVALIKAFREKTGLPIFLNLDHGKTFEYIKEVINAGYDAVNFDGSELPIEENIKITKDVSDYAKKFGVLVEGEVGVMKGASQILEKSPEIKEGDLTNPEDALRFINGTKVDNLAINIGTFHGIEASGENPHINLKRLKEIREKIGDKVFLVLHGGSGTPEEDIREAVKLGIVKININTELRMAFTGTLRKVLEENTGEITPYKYFPKVIEAVQRVVEGKINLFNSVNKI